MYLKELLLSEGWNIFAQYIATCRCRTSPRLNKNLPFGESCISLRIRGCTGKGEKGQKTHKTHEIEVKQPVHTMIHPISSRNSSSRHFFVLFSLLLPYARSLLRIATTFHDLRWALPSYISFYLKSTSADLSWCEDSERSYHIIVLPCNVALIACSLKRTSHLDSP